jgi:hypothetical protein
MKHTNDGKCAKCKEIFDRYPGFNQVLRKWFIDFQAKHPEAHISCAGRGFDEQEAKKAGGKSEASYGQSAHNWNCAIDTFVQLPGKDIYDLDWYLNIFAPAVPYFLRWYGTKESAHDFYERPHIQLREWRGLRAQGLISLVEPIPEGKTA